MDYNMAVRAAPEATGPPDIPSEVASRRIFAVASTTIVLGLAILSYFLRVWARMRSFRKLQADDWLMGAGLLITLEPAICEYLRKYTDDLIPDNNDIGILIRILAVLGNGLGHHIWNVTAEQRIRFLKVFYSFYSH